MRVDRHIQVTRVTDITRQALMHRASHLMHSRLRHLIPDRLLTDHPVPDRITTADLPAVLPVRVLLPARAATAAERR